MQRTPRKTPLYTGNSRVYIIFLILAKKVDSGYSLELPHPGGTNEKLNGWGKSKGNIINNHLLNTISISLK